MSMRSCPPACGKAWAASARRSARGGQDGSLRFAFAETHAYPGCRVALLEADVAGEVIAEFSDGMIVPARQEATADGLRVSVGAYETRSGTRIESKAWLLLPRDAAKDWRVARRIRPNP